MILLRLISWPYTRRHLARTVLTTAGIVLGVGVFLGMHTANQSVLFALHQTVDRVAGATELQVTAGESGFDEEVLERVQAQPEVRVAVPVIEAFVDTGLQGQGSVMVLAVDMTGDRSLRDYSIESGDDSIVDDPLVFLAQPDSLIVTREFADQNRLHSNSRIPMRTMEGPKEFVVRGIMAPGGLAKAFGGNLAIMDVYAAQMVFGRGRKFDRIDLGVAEGFTLDQCRAALEKALGPGFEVETPAGRGRQFDSVLRLYSVTMSITSAFALFIGMFIIYNSFAIAVTERRSEIGILRALGATRRQIRALFLVESSVLGLAGSTIGLGFGYLLARGTAGYLGQMLEGMSGISQGVEDVATDARLMGLALAMGIATSMVAAYIPARNAARVDPVQALQKGKYQVLSAGENRIRRRTALAFAAVAGICLLVDGGNAVFYTGFFLFMLAALLLTPALALWLTRALRPLLGWLWPVEGALAADGLLQAPRRTSATASALMLSLSMTVALGGVARASYESINEWIATSLNPDLFVTASPTLTSRSFRFPAEVGREIGRIEGVEEVQSVRAPRVMFRGTPVMLLTVEIQRWAARTNRPAVEGRADQMYRLAGEGKGAILSQTLSALKNLHAGDSIEIPTPAGILRLPVVGVVEDWSDQQGAIFIDRSVYRKWWNEDHVNTFRVYLRKGASLPAVRAEILEKVGANRRLFALTNEDVRTYITGLTDQWMAMSYSQIAVAVLVAVLGIMNTLTVSIMDRRRELGVLQAVGARRRQIRYTIWMEAFGVAFVGIVLGLGLGAISLHYVLDMTHRDISGMLLPYRFPMGIAGMLFPIILGAAFVAALWPAESAVRGSLVQALEYE